MERPSPTRGKTSALPRSRLPPANAQAGGHLSPAPPAFAHPGATPSGRKQQGLLQTLSKVEQESEDRAFEIIKLRTLVLRIEKEREDARATVRQLTDTSNELKDGFAAATEELQALHKEHNELRCKQWDSPAPGLLASLSDLPNSQAPIVPPGPTTPLSSAASPLADTGLDDNEGHITPRKLAPLFLPIPGFSSALPDPSADSSFTHPFDHITEAPLAPISKQDLDAIAEEEGLQVSLDSQPLTPTAYTKSSGSETQRSFTGHNHTTHILITAPKRAIPRAVAAAAVPDGDARSASPSGARAAVSAIALAVAAAARRSGNGLGSPSVSLRPSSCLGNRGGDEARFSGSPATDVGQQMLVAQLVDFRKRVLFLEGEVASLTEANTAASDGRVELEVRLAEMLADAAVTSSARVPSATGEPGAANDGSGIPRLSMSGGSAGGRTSPPGGRASRNSSDVTKRSIGGGPLGRSESRRSKEGLMTALSMEILRTSGGLVPSSVLNSSLAASEAAAAAAAAQISALINERETNAMLREVEADVLRQQLGSAERALLLAQQPLQAQLAALRLQLSETERQRSELLEEQHDKSSALSEALAVKAELTEKLGALQRSEDISSTALSIAEAQLSQAHVAAMHLEAHASMLESALYDAESNLNSSQLQHASSTAALDDALAANAAAAAAVGGGGDITARGAVNGRTDLSLNLDLILDPEGAQHIVVILREQLAGSERERGLLTGRVVEMETEIVRLRTTPNSPSMNNPVFGLLLSDPTSSESPITRRSPTRTPSPGPAGRPSQIHSSTSLARPKSLEFPPSTRDSDPTSLTLSSDTQTLPPFSAASPDASTSQDISPLPSIDLTSLPLECESAASDPPTSRSQSRNPSEHPPGLADPAHSDLVATIADLHAQLLATQADLAATSAAAQASQCAAQEQYTQLLETFKVQAEKVDTEPLSQSLQQQLQDSLLKSSLLEGTMAETRAECEELSIKREQLQELYRMSSGQVETSGIHIREQTEIVATLTEKLEEQAVAAAVAEKALRDRIQECESQLFVSCQKAAETAHHVTMPRHGPAAAHSPAAASKTELQGVFKKLKTVALSHRITLTGPLAAKLKSEANTITEIQLLQLVSAVLTALEASQTPIPAVQANTLGATTLTRRSDSIESNPSPPSCHPAISSTIHTLTAPSSPSIPFSTAPTTGTTLAALSRSFRHHRSSSSGYAGFADLLPLLGGSGSSSRRVSQAGSGIPLVLTGPLGSASNIQALIGTAVGKAGGSIDGGVSTCSRSSSPLPLEDSATLSPVARSGSMLPPVLLPSLSFSLHTPPKHKKSLSALDGAFVVPPAASEPSREDVVAGGGSSVAAAVSNVLMGTLRAINPSSQQLASQSRPSSASIRSRPGSSNSNHPTGIMTGSANVALMIATGRKESDELISDGVMRSGSSVPHLPSLGLNRSSLSTSSGPGLT